MEDPKYTILYVEDDETIGFLTREQLEQRGYTVHHVSDGQQALQLLNERTFDLCLLDIMLPGADGFTVAQAIRKYNTEIPILFLSARSLVEDRVKGLSLGADDYITKPFSIDELVLRIEVFRKRSSVGMLPNRLSLGTAWFDYANHQLITPTETIQLTWRENELLNLFARHPNTLLPREEILLKVWRNDDYFLGRSLDVFLSRLRKMLKKVPEVKIENVHGVGFRMILK